MSLKAFHLIFISSSILLAFGFAGWELKAYMEDHQRRDLVYCIIGFVLAGVLLIYGRYFLKKLKNISYL